MIPSKKQCPKQLIKVNLVLAQGQQYGVLAELLT